MISIVLLLSFISLGLSFKTTSRNTITFSSPLLSSIKPRHINSKNSFLQLSNTNGELSKTKSIASLMALVMGITLNAGILQPSPSFASDIVTEPLFTKRTNELVQYSDIQRGFKLQRPFGFNEFQGAGTGYMVKFASLFDVDENVVIGSSPAAAGKSSSVTEYGTLEDLGSKLLKKRTGGKLINAFSKETEGIVFYQYEFQNPLDPSLPRPGPKNRKATSQVELYQLCVSKGKLWSVQLTSNDQLFPDHEEAYRNVMKSFIPRL